jgi:hypothetical protein
VLAFGDARHVLRRGQHAFGGLEHLLPGLRQREPARRALHGRAPSASSSWRKWVLTCTGEQRIGRLLLIIGDHQAWRRTSLSSRAFGDGDAQA